MNKYFNRLILLQVLIVLMLSLIIWNRFIRERLPKDIPFSLNTGFFFILLYIYLIYRLIKPKINKATHKIVIPYMNEWVQVLISINEKLIFSSYGKKVIYYFLNKLKGFVFISYNIRYRGILLNYIFLFILPKITLLVCFIIDCFYYNQLRLFYDCIMLITLPTILQYLCYCGKLLREKDIKELEKYFIIEITSEDIVYPKEDYDDDGMLKYDYHRVIHYEDPSTIVYDSTVNSEKKYLNVGNFINYQTNAAESIYLLYEYKILYQEERKDLYMFFFPKDYERYNATIAGITLKTHPITKEQCDYLINTHIYPNVLEKYISDANNYAKTIITNINIILFILFLCCWSYIFIISVYNLKEDIFSLVIPQYENPFK